MATWVSSPKLNLSTVNNETPTDTATTTMHTTSVNTAGESLPPPPDPTGGRRGDRWRWWYLIPFVLGALGATGAALIPIPYYAISPGAAVPTSGLVQVRSGASFDPKGEVFLMTVRLRQVTALEGLRGWLDDAIDVVEEDVIRPPEVTTTQLRDFNLQLMSDSQDKAVVVALQELGFDELRGRGAQVVSVVPSTPADGVLGAGDAIVSVDGEAIALQEEAVRLLGERAPGDDVVLGVADGEGTERRERVTLAENPGAAGRAFLGVALQTKDLGVESPYDFEIDAGAIGGPSGGLALTLEVLDLLTEGELTGGRSVAAIGEIQLDGSVTSVGGVPQKVVAAQRAGATVFLVPRADYEVATARAGDGLRVEPIDDLDDALRVLADEGGNALALSDLGGEVS